MMTQHRLVSVSTLYEDLEVRNMIYSYQFNFLFILKSILLF